MSKALTSDLLERVRRHYIKPGDPLPGGVFLPEVTMGTAGGRRVDALYVGFTSTRGHYLIGHELKVSRADWLHELSQLDKSEAWTSQCHAFYLVVPDESIVLAGELPPDWGLMVIDPRTKTRLRTITPAVMHRDREPSWRTMHSVLKKMDTERMQSVAKARDKAYEDNLDDMVKLRTELNELRNAGQGERAEDSARKVLAAIEDALGIHISMSGFRQSGAHFSIEQLAESLKPWLAAEGEAKALMHWRVGNLEHLSRQIADAQVAVEQASRAYKELES